MTRSHFVKKARKPGKTDKGEPIAAGQSYYWWKFNFSRMVHKSLTPPKPQDLTQSEFMQTVYGISDSISALTVDDIRGGDMSSITSEIETLRDETEDKRSNMPDSLQDVGTGETLQNRVDSLQEWIDEIEGVDIPDEFTDPEPAKPVPPSSDANEQAKVAYEQQMEEYREKKKDWETAKEEYENELESALDEIQQTAYNGE